MLLGQHPELWSIATTDHALNAGPPPAGRAMGDATQLGMVDLYMADPQVAKLIDAFGGTAAPATGGIAKEQARIYGEARYEQLSRLGNAMQSVRDQYSGAMANAAAGGSTAGWVEREVTTTTYDESGGQQTTSLQRSFDPDAFTAWYVAQDGLANQAFRDFYGQSHTTSNGTNESGESFGSTTTFDNPNWTMSGLGGGMSHNELVRIDPNAPPRLNNDSAVGFDLEAGWATHHSNIHQKKDWFEQVVQIAAIAVVGYFTAGAVSGWAAGAGWGSTAAAAAAGAAAGAATAVVSGAMNGNLAFKDILRGALAGGLSGGLLAEFGGVAASYGPVGTVALRTTVQGGIQALLGGSFKDGAIAGFASGLAQLASASLESKIAQAVVNQSMSDAEVFAARTFSKVLGSAIRAAGSPGDPAQAMASAFLSDVLEQADPAGFRQPAGPGEAAPAVDADGNPLADGGQVAAPAPLDVVVDPRVIDGRFVPDADHDAAVAAVNAEMGIDADAPPPGMDDGPIDRDPALRPVGWMSDAANGAAAYAQRLAGKVGGELGSLFQRGAQAANAALSYGDIAPLEAVKADIKNYLDARAAQGGLSEAEIVLFGTLYAATEALFPTNAVEFAGGIGKGIKAAGAVIVAGRSADVLATTARAANVEQAVARQVQAVEQAAHARGLEVVREVPGAKGQWNDALNGTLKPNAVYLLDNGHSHMTDALGRVTRAEGVLDIAKSDRNLYQQVMAGRVGGEGYEGGHLIASLFGGAGERINLVPQLRSINRSEFRVMEREWADAIQAGKIVKVEVVPIYRPGNNVPTEIVARWWTNGVPSQIRFPNTPGG